MSGELCSCFVVHFDYRWNHSSVQQSMLIVGGFVRMPKDYVDYRLNYLRV